MSKKPTFLTSIVALRKAYPGAKLAHRERTILYSPGATVTTLGGNNKNKYKVSNKDAFFIFSYGDFWTANFEVIS